MEQPTILIADDELEIAKLIEICLQKEKYNTILAADGQEALDIIRSRPIDLAILDIMMPKLDGREVIRRLRSNYAFPVIFVSARTSDFDKITGLELGADDYMTKPFNPLELVARVNAQLRRARLAAPAAPVPAESAVLEFAGLIIRPDERSVTVYGQPVELTPKEFDILVLLASHPKKVFSVENLFQHVWGEPYFESGNTVMVHIRTLRRKLGEDKHQTKWIRTVWGVGYTFHG